MDVVAPFVPIALVVVVLGVLVGFALFRWTGTSPAARQREWARLCVFVLQLLYLVMLLFVALWYWQGSKLPVQPKVSLYCFAPNPVGGIPLEIIWFGALGGVLLSLQGIFRHASDWNVSYHLWHVARPFVGGSVAIVAFFLFTITIRATGTEPNLPGPAASPTTTATVVQTPSSTSATSSTSSTLAPAPPAGTAVPTTFGVSPTTTVGASPTTTVPTTGVSTTVGTTTSTVPHDDPYDTKQTRRCVALNGDRPPGRPITPDDHSYIYYVLAFLVGFREATFRRLLRRASDVILTPGGEDDEDKKPTLQLDLDPSTDQQVRVGDELKVQATVTAGSTPRHGEIVRFHVTGTHPRDELGVTDANGVASLAYTGTTAGEDVVRVFVDVNGDGERQVDEPQAIIKVRWAVGGRAARVTR